MGLWNRLLGREPEQRRLAPPFGPALSLGGMGGAMNPRMAENLSTIAACVGAISSGIAALPAYVYRKQDGGRTEAPNHPVSRIIRSPNPQQTWADFIETMMGQVLIHGNAIAVIDSMAPGGLPHCDRFHGHMSVSKFCQAIASFTT
jgi:phage portal protein BeeE